MEIQTFLLAETITRHPDNRHDVIRAAIAYFEVPRETPFPVTFSLPALILLRRETTGGESPFTLRFDLVDEDCRPIGRPHGHAPGMFPPGPRYYSLTTVLEFEFPRPGNYRLDVTVDQGFAAHVFSYNIDLWLKETPRTDVAMRPPERR